MPGYPITGAQWLPSPYVMPAAPLPQVDDSYVATGHMGPYKTDGQGHRGISVMMPSPADFNTMLPQVLV